MNRSQPGRCAATALCGVVILSSWSCGSSETTQDTSAFDAGQSDTGLHDGASASLQRVVVVADNDSTFRATLRTFEGSGDAWTEVFSNPVTIGWKGLGWGIGLHDPQDIPTGDAMKHEGDGKSPMGMFELTRAWGYLPPASVSTALPYETATANLLCIDDVGSPYYNQVIDRESEGLPANDLPSHETMLRGDDLYKYTIFVAHNWPDPVPGSGSCIFMHLWADANDSTIGCTAMAEEDMLRLLAWLDPSKSPVLVQLTRANYDRFASAWELPALP